MFDHAHHRDPASDSTRPASATLPDPSEIGSVLQQKLELVRAQFVRQSTESALRREQRERAERSTRIATRWSELSRTFGRRYSSCTFDSFQASLDSQQKAVGVIRSFCERIADNVSQGICLTLHGPCGTGKDHLLVCCLKAAIRADLTVRWVNGAELFGSFRDAIETGRSEAAAIREYAAPQVLAISDPLPPTGELTPFQQSMLFRILDARYRALQPVWITINAAGRNELDQRMGVALAERLLDAGLVVGCAWPSHRRPVQPGIHAGLPREG